MVEFLGDRILIFKEVKLRTCSREYRKRLVEKLEKVNTSAMQARENMACMSPLHVVVLRSDLVTREMQNHRICSNDPVRNFSKCFFTVIPTCL